MGITSKQRYPQPSTKARHELTTHPSQLAPLLSSPPPLPSPLLPDSMEASGDGVVATRRRRKRSWGGGLGRGGGASIDGLPFSPDPQPRVFWNSRRRSQVKGQSLEKGMEEGSTKALVAATTGSAVNTNKDDSSNKNSVSSIEDSPMLDLASLSDHRKALFEPLDPSTTARHLFANEHPPPPDFDELLSYPKGWLIGKKRKLVNIDVVESMRRIAVREMNRKDREIEGLNEQLEEDARCMERLQEQLLDERRKRAETEREKAMLESQVAILAEMLNDAEEGRGEEGQNHQEQ